MCPVHADRQLGFVWQLTGVLPRTCDEVPTPLSGDVVKTVGGVAAAAGDFDFSGNSSNARAKACRYCI